jgi:hypothetical protein
MTPLKEDALYRDPDREFVAFALTVGTRSCVFAGIGKARLSD